VDTETEETQDDKFVWRAADVVLTQCLLCKHKIKSPIPVCSAFPGAIPAEILANEFDHRQPWIDPDSGEPGDQGVEMTGSILFEPKEGINPIALERLDKHFGKMA
jgi:hypothetical protein